MESEATPNEKTKRKHAPHRSVGRRVLVGTLRLIFFGYLAILIAMVLMEERLIYPGAYVDRSGEGPGSALIETVSIPSGVDVTVPARLMHRKNAKHLILFFHGNGESAKSQDQWITQLSETMDATVMAAEYRGFQDDVKPTERGVLDDCFAARDFLCKRYQAKPTDIIYYGRSLGGGCAVAVAARDGAKALVLEKTFDRAYAVAADRFPFIPVRLLMKNRFDSLAKLTTYRGPLIQIHGNVDTSIPIENAKRLFDSAKCQPKRWIEVPGMGHNDPLPANVLTELSVWLDGIGGQINEAESEN